MEIFWPGRFAVLFSPYDTYIPDARGSSEVGDVDASAGSGSVHSMNHAHLS